MNFKKIIFFMLLLFMSLNQAKAMTPVVEYKDNFYSNRIAPDKTYSGKLGYIVADGRVVFCVDPYHLIGKDYLIDNNYFSNFEEEDLNYMKLIVNYVDPFIQNRNIFYYMAAQELIWEKIMGDNTVFWTTEENGGGKEHNVDLFKADIFAHLEDYLSKPSFDNTSVKDNFFETIELVDNNNVLSNYEIVSSGNNIAWIDDNKLYIKIMTKEQTEIKLVKKIGSGDPIYYYSSSNQDLVDLNSEVEIYSSIFVEANNNYSEQVNINFKDEENLNLINGEILFTIKNGFGEIIEASTYNGLFETTLDEGKYQIEISSVPYGYLLTNPISFEVKESFNNFKSIDILLSKPIGKLIVTSHKERGEFQLYKDEILNTYNDSFETILSLGNYYLIDNEDNTRYEIEISYVDFSTPIIYYYLDIYPKIEEQFPDNDINDNEKEDIADNNDEDKNNEDTNIGETDEEQKLDNEQENNINEIYDENINSDNSENINKNENMDNQNIDQVIINQDESDDLLVIPNRLDSLPNTIDFIEPVKIALFGVFLLGTLSPKKKK